MKKYADIIAQMKENGIRFQESVTREQLSQAEKRYGIHFPEELCRFYEMGMPISDGFVNWLDDSEANVKQIREKIAFPLSSVLLEVEMDVIWPKSWGHRPETEEEAVCAAKKHLEHAASLLPLFSHRYLVDLGEDMDDPVLSVYGGDLIVYGFNLRNWLEVEFCGLPYETVHQETLPSIPGWDCLIG